MSVNVGMPKDVDWQSKNVHTGVYKAPVQGSVMVRRLNIDGDGQGDRNGHGGENRAVMVYQTESYDYWRATLHRDDLTPGAFGENFTVSGLADDSVCIGDRYRIGTAEFEVTQPRVTCFRVGMRLGEPEMPKLLVAHHRPGFYFRVITEGQVCAGDEIVRTRRGPHELSVADVDALLYLPGRDTAQLRLALDIPALSPGWTQSFRELLEPPRTSTPTTGPGFRRMQVIAIHLESPDVLSIEMKADEPLPRPIPGQYLTVRVAGAGDPAPLRSYSLSGDPDADTYRISVKREPRGAVSGWLHEHVTVGATVEAAGPRGDFRLTDDDSAVVLLSAGIGITPVLAMLHRLAAHGSSRRVVWIHTTRDRATNAFADEVTALIDALPLGVQQVVYTGGTAGQRLNRQSIAALELPTDGTAYLCGPNAFMDDMRDALVEAGFESARIRTELFGALPPINPGVVDAPPAVRPHPPTGPPGTGPKVTFSRSGLTVGWASQYRTVLELAEACDVPTRYSCRSGVCHVCVTGVVAGSVAYVEAPLEEPAAGSVLICCAAPLSDLVLDL
jgi:ferredoxin-NADP reductase/MOSC domain-containing protein YiiM